MYWHCLYYGGEEYAGVFGCDGVYQPNKEVWTQIQERPYQTYGDSPRYHTTAIHT